MSSQWWGGGEYRWPEIFTLVYGSLLWRSPRRQEKQRILSCERSNSEAPPSSWGGAGSIRVLYISLIWYGCQPLVRTTFPHGLACEVSFGKFCSLGCTVIVSPLSHIESRKSLSKTNRSQKGSFFIVAIGGGHGSYVNCGSVPWVSQEDMARSGRGKCSPHSAQAHLQWGGRQMTFSRITNLITKMGCLWTCMQMEIFESPYFVGVSKDPLHLTLNCGNSTFTCSSHVLDMFQWYDQGWLSSLVCKGKGKKKQEGFHWLCTLACIH